MKKILFICTGNSCRSLIAEAMTNHLGQGKFDAYSAGSSPAGFAHPKALEILEHAQMDKSDLSSKSWDIFAGQDFDMVVTVCDSAAQESCPIFHGSYEQRHWSLPDPAAVNGSPAEIQVAFQFTFDALKNRIETELL